ncbi:MAG: DNA adenine methylase [Lutibacter sp.]
MNYIGSKHTLSSFLKKTIKSVVTDDLSDLIFCDLFAGTGIVGRTFKPLVKQIIANDIEYYSFVLNKNYIACHSSINEIETLNKIDKSAKIKGFIFNEYSENGKANRLYFSEENGQTIDAIRIQIEELLKRKEINYSEYYFLLASLIESADKVANTAAVYGAFLKNLKKTAQKKLQLAPANSFFDNKNHLVFNEESNQLIHKISGDILYLDPPYNARQYGANYHLLNTIAKYDSFEPKGKTGLRTYYKSNYCKKSEVKKSFEELIKNAKFKYIFLSYNNEGLMDENEIKQIMNRYGSYELITKTYPRFKADKTENRNHKATKTTEYLHILKK